MLDKIQKALNEASGFIKDQASNLGENAKEKAYKTIEEWLQVFPRLEAYGLNVSSFALSVAISPALEVELVGDHNEFPKERLNQILAEVKGNAAMTSVFTTIRTTYSLHRNFSDEFKSPLIVKLKIRISPEIKVYIGEPLIE